MQVLMAPSDLPSRKLSFHQLKNPLELPLKQPLEAVGNNKYVWPWLSLGPKLIQMTLGIMVLPLDQKRNCHTSWCRKDQILFDEY